MGPNASRDIGVSGPVRYDGQVLYTNSWAVVVGFDQYRDERIPRLQYAEADAQALAALLPSVGFPRENITLLLGSRDEVTPQSLTSFLNDNLNDRMLLSDRLLVYIAGHGVCSVVHGEQHGHLLMPASQLRGRWPTAENPHLEQTPKGALEMKLLLEVIRGLQPRHRLLLLDACFSGYAARAIEAPAPLKANDPRIRRWLSEPVTQVLTAGRSGQRAFESPRYGHGVFTHYVLKALEGNADLEGRGLITFGEFAHYVRDRVAREEETDQDPQSDHYGEGQYLLMMKPAPGPSDDLMVSPAGGQFARIGDAVRAARPGQKIVVRSGVYRESVVLDREVEIAGESGSVIESQGAPCIVMQTECAVVRNLTLRVAGTAESFAVHIPRGEFLLEDCDVTSPTRTCVFVEGDITRAVVRRCRLHDAKRHGLAVMGRAQCIIENSKIERSESCGASAVEFANLVCQNCEIAGGNTGAQAAGDASLTLQHTRIQGTNEGGILMFERASGVIEDCEIAGCKIAIQITGSSNPVVRRSRIHDNQAPGIDVFDHAAPTVEDCELFGNDLCGLSVQGQAKPVIRRSRIYGNRGTGFGMWENAAPTIEDCDIDSNESVGMGIYGQAMPVLRRSRVHAGKSGGISVQDTAAPAIEDCEIFGNTLAGIEIRGQANPAISRCNLRDGKASSIHCFENGAGIIEDCDISGSVESGVIIREKARPVIRRCKIHDTRGRAGINITDAAGGAIEDCEIFRNSSYGITLSSGGKPAIRGCRVHHHVREAAILAVDASGRIQDCQIYANQSGIHLMENGSLTVVGCVIWGLDPEYPAIGTDWSGAARVENCRLINEGGSIFNKSGKVQAHNNVLVPAEYDQVWNQCRMIVAPEAKVRFRAQLRQMWQTYGFAEGK